MGLKFNGKKVRTVTCPACGGTGKVRVLLRKSGGKRIKCGECLGEGKTVKIGGGK